MILCVNCNPCVDTTEVLDPEEHDEVEAEVSCLAGKGLNCARVLASLGRSSRVIGFMPEGEKEAFENECAARGVPCDFVAVGGNVRRNVKRIRKGQLRESVRSEGFSVTQPQQDELAALYAERVAGAEAVLLSGSLPPGCDDAFYRRLMESTPAGVLVFLDTHGAPLAAAMAARPAVIKPNGEELAEYTGHALRHRRSVLAAIEKAHADGAGAVLLSLGRDGAMLSDGKQVLKARQRNVTAVNPVGAGDAMLSAAADRMIAGAGAEEILRHAVAAGSAKVLELSAADFDVRLYRSLLGNVEVEKA